MCPGIAIGNYIGKKLENWAAYWAAYWTSRFTGIPIQYSDAVREYVTVSKTFDIVTGIYFRDMTYLSGVYHMFYEVWESSKWGIRKRTGTDGLNFSVQSTNLLFALGGVGEFDEKGQADPSVIYDGSGDWKMWFDAWDGSNVWDKLGYGTSADGTTWTKYGSILDRGAGGEWDSGMLHHPAVLKYNGVYYMFYSGSDTADLKNIGLATSTDGINWTKEPSNPVLVRGTSPDWDDNYIRPARPILLYGIWYMWYWGHKLSTDKHSMGLAVSTDLINWTKRGKVLDEVRGHNCILVEGSNPLDKIFQMWSFNLVAPTLAIGFATITLPTTKTLLKQFAPVNVYTDADGDVTFENTATDGHAGNYIYFGRITVADNITPDAINMVFSSMLKPMTGNVKAALYANGANTPTTLLAITQERAWAGIAGSQWAKFSFISNPSLTAADYWIAVWSTDWYYREKGAGGANNWGNKSLAYAADFPTPASATTTGAFSNHNLCVTVGSQEHIWSIALVGEPNNVYFNNMKGSKKAGLTQVTTVLDWYWAANVLYVYCVENVNIRYQISYD